jgi:5-methylcytosine-specific restriction endonuclease McrA
MLELYAAPPRHFGFDESKLKLGHLCKHKHDWMSTGQSLRRIRGRHCVECENLRAQDRISNGERREFRQKKYNSLRELGLTTRGTPLLSPVMQAALLGDEEQRAMLKAIRQSGRRPSVARLVMNEQRRYWRENPEASSEHKRQWSQASWWLKYQINPELRLYHREKSKRRKAQDRGQTPVQISVTALRQRFNEFGNCCAYCGDGGDMQIEHVEPISKGGAHDIGNIVPACPRCNTSKRNHEMEEWYRSQPFFSELRLHRIRRLMRPPEAYQLAMM